MSANSSAIVNSILVNGYSINMNGGVYRRGKPKSFEAIAFTAGRFFELEQQLQPGDHHVANGDVMLMNAFTHDDVDARYRKCGYID